MIFAGTWAKTPQGHPSTAGTTASIAFIRRGKIYTGHVGDSAIVLGQENESGFWEGLCLTRDHKPENPEETQRILEGGGKVVAKSGVPRVVWKRPAKGHQGATRRSTQIEEIPFLAVARSLGDLWSYNSEKDVFIVSPEPDTYCHDIDISRHRCLVLGTDGCWNMLSPETVSTLQFTDYHQCSIFASGTAISHTVLVIDSTTYTYEKCHNCQI